VEYVQATTQNAIWLSLEHGLRAGRHRGLPHAYDTKHDRMSGKPTTEGSAHATRGIHAILIPAALKGVILQKIRVNIA